VCVRVCVCVCVRVCSTGLLTSSTRVHFTAKSPTKNVKLIKLIMSVIEVIQLLLNASNYTIFL